jgi:hypothetical protein
MTNSPLLALHIAGAITGLLAGTAALLSPKGAHLHRVAGNIFFIAMLCMSASAAWLALLKSQTMNLVVGTLTFYLVGSAWLTMVRKAGHTGLLERGLLLIVLADAAAALILGWEAANGIGMAKDGAPTAAYFVFGSVALLASALDIRVLIRGGVAGASRIARHLWRMCAALLIAVTSLFLGKQSLLPAAIIQTHLYLLPILTVIVLMIYWLIRVHFTSAYRKARKPAAPASLAPDIWPKRSVPTRPI